MAWPLPVATAPAPIQTNFADEAILARLPDAVPRSTRLPPSAAAMAEEVQALIDQARGSGDPRFLGYAERRFQQWPDDAMTDRLRVLRATLAQSLHRFDEARQDLAEVLNRSADRRQRIQARLTLANLETVQGRYHQARTHCQRLSTEFPGLIAASCLAQVDARSGAPRAAYDRLANQLAAAGNTGSAGYLWARGTLGDIAAQLGLASAEAHWQAVLASSPTDLYTLTQLADWYLRNGQVQSVMALTLGYEQVDALAVLRVIAMRRTRHPDQDGLANRIRERFEEAQWRGALLHKRDFARFQLAIEERPDIALRHAMANWETQREPLDTALALRAAIAADDQAAVRTLRNWLEQTGQSDARYPELP
ncbi:hypothetical protein QQF73_12855 [Marinobacter sp. M216]|uniref:Tetratricopeptide repeat-containing protein n=1 Tax=Marinobacter albus TaxID=3030833 RepID=A0ABT7HFB6_9GAMM|nr:hypothetical protein [Marinobacter sp. M216]MDK9558515.1 hypothetical protein [Marinobacter sp. M216]